MSLNKGTNQSVVSGRNVYQDKKGQNVLYIPSTKCGYVIKPQAESGFILYHNRVAIVIAAIMIALSFNIDWKLVLPAGAVFFGLLEWRFRSSYLPSLTCITNFKPEKKRTRIQGLVEDGNILRSVALGVAYLALGVLMVINGYEIHSPMILLVCDYVVLAGCIYMSVQYFIAVYQIATKKK